MYYPGWLASVNGVEEKVSASGPFQIISVPKGDALVKFSYAPTHIKLAVAVALAAILVWLACAVAGLGVGPAAPGRQDFDELPPPTSCE